MANSTPMFERRTAPQQRKQQSSCCGCCNASSRVGPEEGTYSGYDIVEVRPYCTVRVRHINPVPRESSFDQQMDILIQKHKSRLKPKPPFHSRLFSASTRARDTSRDANTTKDTQHDNDIDNISISSGVLDNTAANRRGTRTATSIEIELRNQKNGPKRKTSQPQRIHPATPQRIHPATPQRTNTTLGATSRISATPLFMIHGVGGSSDVWQAQINYFASEGYEIIAPDFVGHGFSSAPDKASVYRFESICEDLLYIFDMYCKPRNIIIGHSYGASFAAELSRHRGQHIEKMILLSGGSPTPLAPQPGLFSFPACFLACCRPLLARGFNKSAFKQLGQSVSLEQATLAFDVPSYVLRHIMRGQSWPNGDAEYHKLHITCPVLLIHGEHDALVSVAEEQEMEETLDNCLLFVLPDASHMVMMEQPEKVNALVHEFITIDIDMSSNHPSNQNNHTAAISNQSNQSNQRNHHKPSIQNNHCPNIENINNNRQSSASGANRKQSTGPGANRKQSEGPGANRKQSEGTGANRKQSEGTGANRKQSPSNRTNHTGLIGRNGRSNSSVSLSSVKSISSNLLLNNIKP